MRKPSFLLSVSTLMLGLAAFTPASAQDQEVPYWASIRAEKVNMRVGPGVSFPIDWIYQRPGLPVKVVRVMQGWRLVRDPGGVQGWIVGRLLTRERGAIVIGEEPTEIRAEPSDSAEISWRVEPGVVGQLGDCDDRWCEFAVAGRSGWIAMSSIWGAGDP